MTTATDQVHSDADGLFEKSDGEAAIAAAPEIDGSGPRYDGGGGIEGSKNFVFQFLKVLHGGNYPELSLPEHQVLGVYLTMADGRGAAFPGNELLARITRLNIRSVRRIRARLAARGLIEPVNAAGGRGARGYWRIVLPVAMIRGLQTLFEPAIKELDELAPGVRSGPLGKDKEDPACAPLSDGADEKRRTEAPQKEDPHTVLLSPHADVLGKRLEDPACAPLSAPGGPARAQKEDPIAVLLFTHSDGERRTGADQKGDLLGSKGGPVRVERRTLCGSSEVVEVREAAAEVGREDDVAAAEPDGLNPPPPPTPHPTTAADTPSPPNTSALPTTAPPTIARDGSLAPTSGPNPPGLQSAAPPPTYPAGWQSELSRRRMDAGTIDWVQERGHAWDVVKATLTRFDAASRAGRIENPPGWMRTVLPEVAASHRPAAATPNPPPRPPIDVQAVIDRDRAIRREAISRDREWEEAQKAIVPRPFPFSTAPPPRRQVTLLPRPLAPPADAAIDQAFEQKRRQAVASLDSLPPPPTASPSSGPQPPLPGSEHSTTVKEEPHAPAA